MSIKINERVNKHGETQWQTQFIGENGEIVSWTENYTTKQNATKAIGIVAEIIAKYFASLVNNNAADPPEGEPVKFELDPNVFPLAGDQMAQEDKT